VLKKFDEFRREFNLDLNWPCEIPVLVAYIAYLSKEKWAHSTICSHLSAIGFFHKINGWSDPTGSFIVKKLREGSGRLNQVKDIRRPITFQILQRLISVLPAICSSSYEVILFKSVFLLAFYGFLRVGEYSCDSMSSGSSRVLTPADIRFNDSNQIEVRIRFSKTDQRGNSSIIFIGSIQDGHLCPTLALKEFLRIRPQSDGPLFIHFDLKPLTKAQVGRVLKLGVETIGLVPAEFTPHSLRIGAATSAAIRGVPEETIKEMGRWKSGAYKSYIRPNRLISLF